MKFNLLLKFIISMTVSCLTYAIEEFCNSEIFQPKCSENEIILIHEAFFGRRSIGKCLLEEGKPSQNYLSDPQFIGCYADVKKDLESTCSGRNSCEMIVSKIKAATNCHNWLKLHLEIGYECLKIVPNNRQCIVKLTDGKIQLTNGHDLTNICGTNKNPWKVEAINGQRVNISLLYFLDGNSGYLDLGIEERQECIEKGLIIEKSNRKQTRICIYSDRKKHVASYYLSESDTVDIVMENVDIMKNKGFILGLEATGCSDLIPPSDAWLKRNENEATIGCYSTRLRWKLKCVGQRWIGVIGNCSQGFETNPILTQDIDPVAFSENQVVPIVAIAVAGFVLCFFIVCIGFVFLSRYYAIRKARMMKEDIEKNKMLFSTNNDGNREMFYHMSHNTWKQQNENLNCEDKKLENLAYYFELDKTVACN